jgi:uncharacterized ParB-like nuclease family protein
MLLEIARIKATPEAQPRVSLHYPTVEEYAEALRGEVELDPVTVFHDGTDYWLADGFHRLEAYKREGFSEIPVNVMKGGHRAAILFSVGANHKHGLPRTPADKRRAIETLLRDQEWGANSDRWIAETARVNHETVTSVRRILESTGEIRQLDERKGKDGKTRKLPRKSDPAPKGEEAPVDQPEVAVDESAAPRNGRRPSDEREAPRPEPVNSEPVRRVPRPEDFPTLTERDTMTALVNALRVARRFNEKSWEMAVQIIDYEVGVREHGYRESA